MIKKERQASVKKVEEEHEKAGIEFPQSLREEMEGAATNRPFIKIMKLKEASPEILYESSSRGCCCRTVHGALLICKL